MKNRIKYILVTTLLVIVVIAILGNDKQNNQLQMKQKNNAGMSSKIQSIPGIYAVDIYGNLKQKGFKCTDVKTTNIESKQIVSWTCTDTDKTKEYIVEITGTAHNKIFYIQAAVLNYGQEKIEEVAKDFLSYIASIPYKNSKPDEAQLWVQKNITQDQAEIVISDVHFRIYSNNRAKILSIGDDNFMFSINK